MLSIGFLFSDALVTGAAAWLVVRASGHDRHGVLETGLAWFWSFVALIAGSGVALGILGGFGAGGFFVSHALTLAGLALMRRNLLGADRRALRAPAGTLRGLFNTPGHERSVALALLLVLAALSVIAALAEPAVMDALTYHLPRIGHWLQEGRIRVVDTSDARLNFVADLPDIVMAWFAGGAREGFRLVVLAQAIGGFMAVGATVGLARVSGLTRVEAMLAGGLLLGMANVVAQFTCAQTDLFTTGVFTAAFFLWLVALRRGECSVLGALGAGLALGAKGTLFYLAPSALLWVGWLAWHHRLGWRAWRRTLVAAALGVGLFAGPGFARNLLAYGGALGPAAWVTKHHQGFDSVSGQMHKLYWNLTASLAQNFAPQSQPDGLRPIAGALSRNLIQKLPERDPYTLAGLNRKETLESISRRPDPDADLVSFGLVTFSVFLLGVGMAFLRWRRPQAALILVWSAGVGIFLIFFHAMQQWHPYAFRYFVLVAPWVAVVAAWGIGQLEQPWRQLLWWVATACALSVAWQVTGRVSQGGWKTVARPERSLEYFVSHGWRTWSQHFDHPAAPFRLALPEERPIAAFYRQWPPRRVAYKSDPDNAVSTAEDFVRGEPGWAIVPAERFIGREGQVAGKTWLFNGDAGNVYSLAAFRTLDPGEEAPAIVYRQQRIVDASAVTYELLVKPAKGQKLSLALANPGATCAYAWYSPSAKGNGTLRAGEKLVLGLSLPDDTVDEARIVFSAIDGKTSEPILATLEIIP
jgi:hypothetical protein